LILAKERWLQIRPHERRQFELNLTIHDLWARVAGEINNHITSFDFAVIKTTGKSQIERQCRRISDTSKRVQMNSVPMKAHRSEGGMRATDHHHLQI
jgi:hypothetical protein